MTRECIFCGKQAENQWIPFENEGERRMEEFFDCPHCGAFFIPNSTMLPYVFGKNTDRKTFLVRCYLNETQPKHDLQNPIRLSSSVLNWIVDQVPKTVEEKIEKLLNYINARTSYFGETVELTNEVIYSTEEFELYNLVEALKSRGLIDDRFATDASLSVSLTLEGVEAIKRNRMALQENKSFIAMWFTDEMNKVYDEVIVPACIAAGYEPVRVDKEHYNGDITDKIISLIRTTAFSIADYTGNRGGVYYEAGFAKGLGKEVIMTCREDWFNKEEEGHKVHFDVNHINMIVWKKENLEQFKEDLKNRIIATIGKGSFEPN